MSYYYIIKRPDGSFDTWTFADTRSGAIDLIAKFMPLDQRRKHWRSLYDQGYRCVKVKLTEVEE